MLPKMHETEEKTLPYDGMIRTGSKGSSQSELSPDTPSERSAESTRLPGRVNRLMPMRPFCFADCTVDNRMEPA